MTYDKNKVLEEIKKEAGLMEQQEDEYTTAEIAEKLGIASQNVISFLERRGLIASKRSAYVNGRRGYLIKLKVKS